MTMTPAPLLSIVTITRQNRDGLAMTAQSIATQTRDDYEWIVIDGASNDGTVQLLERYSPKPDIVLSEPDQGIYDAMNKGLTRANGAYTLFLNAGDRLATAETLEHIYTELSAHCPDFLYGDSYEQSHDGNRDIKPARSHTKAALGLFTHHQAMIYKTEILKKLRYNTDYKIAADYDLTLQFLKKAQNIYYTPTPVCVFISGGLSQTMANKGRMEQFVIRHKLKTVPFWQNMLIYTAQYLNWHFRKLIPGVYWFLKRSARSGDNTNNGSAPT